MALEIERKYLDVDHNALRTRLEKLGARSLGAWFESNTVYDDQARSLKAAGTLLRLREKKGCFVLTLKRKPDKDPTSASVKTYEENETEASNGEALRAILTGLGYRAAFRYEKIREKWQHSGCAICLDTLPFGSYMEIEGAEADIETCATALELPKSNASTATYHELNRLYRAAHNIPVDESFVFDPDTAKRLREELAGNPLDSVPQGA